MAGTKIRTAEGLIPIEMVQPGDKVWAQDEKTGHVALKEVVRAFRNETSELVKIQLSGEQTTTTPEHPFYAPTKGWTEAIHLRAGDKLFNHNGELMVIEQVQHEILEAPPVVVYNFEGRTTIPISLEQTGFWCIIRVMRIVLMLVNYH